MNDLEKLLSEEKDTSKSTPPSEETQENKKDEEVLKKEEHLANLNKAIEQANDLLRKKRAEIKKPVEEEELPKINMEDPSAKAWDRHINEKVNPLNAELEKEKEEIRTFALQEFLADKPALASNPDKVKELVSYYDRIKTASERTKEGVLVDLKRAYAAINHESLLRIAQQSRIEKAESDILLSDIAVSRGATSYSEQKEPQKETLSDDDKNILARWGIDPKEWQEDRKKYG